MSKPVVTKYPGACMDIIWDSMTTSEYDKINLIAEQLRKIGVNAEARGSQAFRPIPRNTPGLKPHSYPFYQPVHFIISECPTK